MFHLHFVFWFFIGFDFDFCLFFANTGISGSRTPRVGIDSQDISHCEGSQPFQSEVGGTLHVQSFESVVNHKLNASITPNVSHEVQREAKQASEQVVTSIRNS